MGRLEKRAKVPQKASVSVVLEQALDCFLVELASRDSREPRRNVSQDTVAVVGNERTLTVGTQWLLVGPTQPLGERLALPCEYFFWSTHSLPQSPVQVLGGAEGLNSAS